MKRVTPRELQVLQVTEVSMHMRRVTLGGAGYEGFPEGVAGSYIKLFFDVGNEEPALRTYTVRSQRHSEREIDVDFVLHGDSGLASAWANRVAEGQRIRVGGPGPGRMINTDADWFFLAGDMTALPALSVNLEQLPEAAKGYVVIEVLEEGDMQPLKLPKGMQLFWVINPDRKNPQALVHEVRGQTWLPGRPAVWAACEFDAMKALRKYFKQERQIDRERFYISSYWKQGVSEDHHKKIKRVDADDDAKKDADNNSLANSAV